MLASDIINHLITHLPRYTSLFNDELKVSSFVVSGDTITIQFDSVHNLQTGDKISIHNAYVDLSIDSFTSLNNIVTATTSQDHDLTENYQKNITIENSNITELNNTFDLLGVPNRRTFTFASDADVSGDIGSPLLLQMYEDNLINDIHTVTVIDANTVTITVINNNYTNINISNIKVSTQIRISGAATLDRLIEAFEGSSNINYWLYVVLDEYQTGKARSSVLDAIQNVSNLNSWNIEQLANFSIYVFIPSKNEITGRLARDIAESLRPSLYKTLINAQFDTGLSGASPMSNVTPISDNIIGYSDSYYIHQYQWQQINQVTGDDVFTNPVTRAFRNLGNQFLNENNEIIINDDYNLDDEPIEN